MSILNIQPNNITKNLCANKLIKGIKQVACGDLIMCRFINRLAKASYYDPETGNFVLDISRWHSGVSPIFKASFADDVESSDFELFFLESMQIYYSYLWYKEHIPFLVDGTIKEKVLSYVAANRFCPSHMEIIDNVPQELLNKKESQNVPPVSLPEIPLIMLAADKEFYDEGVDNYVSGTATSFGMRDQYTNSVITGVTNKGMETNLANMALNQGEVDGISNELLISGVMMMMHDCEASTQKRVMVEIPDAEKLEAVIKNYKTGTGVVPATNFVTQRVTSLGEVVVDKNKPKTKKAIACFLTNLIVKTLTDIYERDEIWDRVFPGVSVYVSSRKFEILNAVESLNLEELETVHSKLRIFFVESAHTIFLSYIAMKGIFDYLSRKGWEAGTSLNDGGFFDIFRRHAAGTTDCHAEDGEKFKPIYEKYPFLKARSYFEGDISKFDQSLLYRVLGFVGIFFASWFSMKDKLTLTVLGNVIFRLMFKYLYVIPLQQLYAVQGMMFSGTFETSHGDTAYQMLVYFCFISHILEKYKDSENYSILKEAIEWDLICKSFMGDDTLLSWPTAFETMFGMTGDYYVKFVARFGLKFKYFFKKPLFGVVVNVKKNSIWHTVQTQTSVTFLKNSMCYNFDIVDGKVSMVGIYPYRSAYDLNFRIGNSDKANATIDGFMAKLISIGFLSIGNRQVYTYTRKVYELAIRLYGKPIFDRERLEALMKGSGALYNLFQQNINDFEFPDFDDLRMRHDQHVIKPRKAINMTFGTAEEIRRISIIMGFNGEFEW